MRETWVLAFRFPDSQSAKQAWEHVRDLIFMQDCDASVYRAQINGEWHAVIVGWDSVSAAMRGIFADLCSEGSAVVIPEVVSEYLVERRNKTAIPGAFWQRRGTSRPRFRP